MASRAPRASRCLEKSSVIETQQRVPPEIFDPVMAPVYWT